MVTHQWNLVATLLSHQVFISILLVIFEVKIKINLNKINNEINNLKSYLKSDPTLFPFSGSPGSGHKLEAVLIPPSFTGTTEKRKEKNNQNIYD